MPFLTDIFRWIGRAGQRVFMHVDQQHQSHTQLEGSGLDWLDNNLKSKPRGRIPWVRASLALAFFLIIGGLALPLRQRNNISPKANQLEDIASAIKKVSTKLPEGWPATLLLQYIPGEPNLADTKRASLLVEVPFPEASCGPSSSRRWYGTVPGQRVAILIRNLGRELAECAYSGASLHVEVRGFSSTSAVSPSSRCRNSLNGKVANLRIANRREEAVARLLRAGAAAVDVSNAIGNRLKINDILWTKVKDLVKARRYLDVIGGQYSTALGSFNRRAEIQVSPFGSCALNSLANRGLLNTEK